MHGDCFVPLASLSVKYFVAMLQVMTDELRTGFLQLLHRCTETGLDAGELMQQQCHHLLTHCAAKGQYRDAVSSILAEVKLSNNKPANCFNWNIFALVFLPEQELPFKAAAMSQLM